jgi:hypothetical protein
MTPEGVSAKRFFFHQSAVCLSGHGCVDLDSHCCFGSPQMTPEGVSAKRFFFIKPQRAFQDTAAWTSIRIVVLGPRRWLPKGSLRKGFFDSSNRSVPFRTRLRGRRFALLFWVPADDSQRGLCEKVFFSSNRSVPFRTRLRGPRFALLFWVPADDSRRGLCEKVFYFL